MAEIFTEANAAETAEDDDGADPFDAAEGMIDEADKDCSGGCDYEEFTHIILATQ